MNKIKKNVKSTSLSGQKCTAKDFYALKFYRERPCYKTTLFIFINFLFYLNEICYPLLNQKVGSRLQKCYSFSFSFAFVRELIL